MKHAIFPFCLLLLATGCPSEPPEPEIYLHRLTAAPITTDADVFNPVDGVKRIEMSSGVAVGLGCTEYCPDTTRGRCEDTRVEVSPEGLAEVHEAFLLDGRAGAVVLVAGDPGSGTVTISSPCARAEYRLDIR